MPQERKALRFQLKEGGPEGSFTAVFATMNVIDHDEDVTRPGAFAKGAEVIVGAWGHKSRELPVGKGVITVVDREAAVEGQFFLDTGPGKDTYQTVKNLGGLGEWSYIYEATRYSFGEFEGKRVRFLDEIKVYSVDPVLAGAGIDTGTTSIKGLQPFAEEAEAVLAAVEAFEVRAKSLAELRAKEGRMMSDGNMERLRRVHRAMTGAVADMGQMMTDLDPPKSNELVQELLRSEFLRFQRITAGQPA